MRPRRQNVVLAFLGAVFLHGVALGLFALIVALHPPTPESPPPEQEETLKLEVVQDQPPDTPPPPVDVATPTPTSTPRMIVDATGPDADTTPSPDALLSDRNTRSSSAEDETGEQPGATQKGRKMASFVFDPRPPAPGLITRADPPAPTPPPQTAPSLPQPDRSVKRPPATPHPYSEPLPPDPTPAPTTYPDEFALAMATPPPPPEDPFDPSIRSTSPALPKSVASKATPTPPVGASRSAQTGRSSVRGPGGLETVATPSGRYGLQVTNIIKSTWTKSINRWDDQSFGTAIIHFTVDKDGLVLAPRIASNTANILFGSIALQSVAVSRLPPMPPDVADELGGKLVIDVTFDLTPMPGDTAEH